MLQKRMPGRKHKNGHYHRRISTTQERRANQDGMCRPSRKPHRLPNAYDDIVRKDIDDRSWKRYRDHQWKVKPCDTCIDE